MKKTKSISKQKRFPLKPRGRSQQVTFDSFFGQFLEILNEGQEEQVLTKSRNMNDNIRNMIFEEKPDK